jgi:hypothetical protein
VLSTGPYAPLTHWYQVRCQIRNPLMARAGDTLVGKVVMTVNKRQSYDITMDLGTFALPCPALPCPFCAGSAHARCGCAASVFTATACHLCSAELEGTGHKARNVLNLKDPFYRCSEYTGPAAQSAGAGAAQPNGNGAEQEPNQADEMEYEDAE